MLFSGKLETKRFAVLLSLVVICLFGLPTYAQYSGGNGTAEDPYQIATAADLMLLGETPEDYDKHFILTADIDLASYTGTDFNIIGNQFFPFTGVFDGNGKQILNFNYTSTGTDNIGLFGYVSGANAQIKDLALIDPNCSVSGLPLGVAVGSLVDTLEGGSISGCIAENARVLGFAGAGGLVGSNSGTIINCTSSGSISRRGFLGGLVGSNSGTIINCTSSARISSGGGFSGGSVGGLVGYNEGRIIECNSSGSVGAHFYAGGLVGVNSGIIANCYSRSDVLRANSAGGLVGENSGLIANCYSVGSPRHPRVWGGGGLVGSSDDGTVAASFWDIETSGVTSSAGGIGVTTAEMQTASTFLEAGWDFVNEIENGTEDLWKISGGFDYPRFGWEKYSGGTGEPNAPYQIATVDDLMLLGDSPEDYDKHFALMADIDLAAYTGTDFNMIGNEDFPFTGVFDGMAKKILNFTGNIGLFGYVSGANAQIKDLVLIDPNYSGGRRVGSLVGTLEGGSISACIVENASISGRELGGLVGYNSGTIINCTSSGSISGGYGRGGFAAGGLVGYNDGRIIECNSSGSVGDHFDAGGLVGVNSGIIANCHSSSDVVRGYYRGGLVGQNSGIIANCYSVGLCGGLVGRSDGGTVTASFWDIETSGATSSAGGTGKSTEQMCRIETFLAAGWDFVDTWDICTCTNYPKLQWQIPPGDVVCSDGVSMIDFSFLAEHWLGITCDLGNDYCQGADLDRSGTVDVADLGVLADNWLAGITSPDVLHLTGFNLLAHWKLDETEGRIAHDSAGDNEAGLVVMGDPLWQPDGGKVDGALELGGNPGFGFSHFALNLTYCPFKVYTWVKGGAPGQVIISQSNGGLLVSWLWASPSDGRLRTSLMHPEPPLESESVITDGDWHRIGLVWDGCFRHLYVDGVEVAKDTHSVDPMPADGGLYFGVGQDAGSFWAGLIDDVIIYERINIP